MLSIKYGVVLGLALKAYDAFQFSVVHNKFLSLSLSLPLLELSDRWLPKSDCGEGIVLKFVNAFHLKKATIQKALDGLADSGKILFKEYGKQKIYQARQKTSSISQTVTSSIR